MSRIAIPRAHRSREHEAVFGNQNASQLRFALHDIYPRKWRVATTQVVGAALAALLNGTVYAAPAPAKTAAADTGGLEEVVVTARRREESIQKVPEAVAAVSGEQIEQTFQSTVQGLEGMSPNLVIDRITAGPGGGAISVRGLSFQDIEKSFDSAVGISLDGVALGTNTGQIFRLFDIERMELLRGPQGTLFGKNTIGGTINVLRPEPTGELGGKLRVGGGSRNLQTVDGVVNLPMMGDQFSAKLYYSSRKQEGPDKNLFHGGRHEGNTDDESYGLALKWTPTDKLKFVYRYDKDDDNSGISPSLNLSLSTDLFCAAFGHCSRDGQGVVPETGDVHATNSNGSDKAFYHVDAHTLNAEWQFADGYTLNYVFGYRKSDEHTHQDFDATPVTFFETERIQDYHQTSHELRLTYDQGGAFNFVSGLYYWESDYKLHQNTFGFFDILNSLGALGPGLTGAGPIVESQDTKHNTKSWAAFAQSDIKLTEAWIVTLGGRYTRESKWMQSRQDLNFTGFGISSNLFNTFPVKPSDSWSKFTPKAGIRWQIDPDQMAYLSYSTGFRSGGYNGRAGSYNGATIPYDPETVDSIELGYKSQWLDNRLRFNADIFHSKYKDKQEEVVVPVPGGFQETLVTNAASAKFDGIELELQAIPVEGWTLRGNLGTLDAKYDDFCANPSNPYVTGPSCGPGGKIDMSGLKLRRAPKITYSLDSTSVWKWGPGQATFNVGVRHKDDYYVTFQNTPLGLAKAASIWDASFSYDWDQWRVSVYGHNLTDKKVLNSSLFVAGLWSFGSYNLPREYGVQLQYSFGR